MALLVPGRALLYLSLFLFSLDFTLEPIGRWLQLKRIVRRGCDERLVVRIATQSLRSYMWTNRLGKTVPAILHIEPLIKRTEPLHLHRLLRLLAGDLECNALDLVALLHAHESVVLLIKCLVK